MRKLISLQYIYPRTANVYSNEKIYQDLHSWKVSFSLGEYKKCTILFYFILFDMRFNYQFGDICLTGFRIGFRERKKTCAFESSPS